MAALNYNPMSFMGNTNQVFAKPPPPQNPQIPGVLRQKAATKFLDRTFDKGFQNAGTVSKSLTPVDVGTKAGVW